MTEQLEFVTTCGLYCGLCSARSRIPQRARALQEAMTVEGWPDWGAEIPGFAPFWRFLEGLHAAGGCPGCRAGGGPPFCQIRQCAQERALDLCSECSDFPCSHIEALGAIYPTLITDNRRLQTVGLAQWLDEQEERARRGVVYADIRYQVDAAVAEQAFGAPEP
ncbi:MAG: DUF3795 domain-containing protein [Chloroflexi bacterium]|nr:DUF3795 domain-containing protein [Chloroflexota bacterium]MBU1748642.1 DUF3795 domain-containing protein [Chloroflexota bacterium]